MEYHKIYTLFERDKATFVVDPTALKAVPNLGRMTLDQIVALVREPFPSKIGTAMAEGIVARPIETLYDKHKKRIIIKLKTKDFQPGKR